MVVKISNLINCRGIISTEIFDKIQNKLGVRLPEKYFMTVQNCDGGIPIKSEFFYYDVDFQKQRWTGIGKFLQLNDTPYSNLCKIAEYPPEFFPKCLIAFAETGGGDYICFDYRQGKDNPNPPIVYWNHEADIGKDVSFVANSFEEFLGMLKEPED